MPPRFIRACILAVAFSAPLAAACIDDHTAEECNLIGTCPLPDAGDGGDAGLEASDN